MTPPGRLRKILGTARKAGEQHLPDRVLICLGEDASWDFHSGVPGAMLQTTRSGWIDTPIPADIAANGPRALKVTGEYGDGHITLLYEDASVLENHLHVIRGGALEAGRTDRCARGYALNRTERSTDHLDTALAVLVLAPKKISSQRRHSNFARRSVVWTLSQQPTRLGFTLKSGVRASPRSCFLVGRSRTAGCRDNFDQGLKRG